MTFTTAELHHRESNGIAVSLVWDRETNDLTVRVVDASEGEEFELSCAPEEALEVFHHPYEYATPRRLRFRNTVALAHA